MLILLYNKLMNEQYILHVAYKAFKRVDEKIVVSIFMHSLTLAGQSTQGHLLRHLLDCAQANLQIAGEGKQGP